MDAVRLSYSTAASACFWGDFTTVQHFVMDQGSAALFFPGCRGLNKILPTMLSPKQAQATELHINTKLSDLIAKTCGHLF